MGCFSETDTFVALIWNYRENIENDKHWRTEVERCKTEWEKLFCGLPRFKGRQLNEYISYNFRAV